MKFVTKRTFLLTAIIIAASGLLGWFSYFGVKWCAIRVTVTNVGESSMMEVSIVLSANTKQYPLGDLGLLNPGVTKTVWVRPNGTGTIDLQFQNSAGQKTNLMLYGYVEAGYVGTITVDLSDGRLLRCTNEIHVSAY